MSKRPRDEILAGLQRELKSQHGIKSTLLGTGLYIHAHNRRVVATRVGDWITVEQRWTARTEQLIDLNDPNSIDHFLAAIQPPNQEKS